MSNTCVILYSECEFKGEHIEVCEDIKNIQEEAGLDVVKAIEIPAGFEKLPVYLHT